jgi:F-type H+-transporting ATPase subunit gamma
VAGSILKRRIKSVTNTRKITKAMGLVATAKLRKTKELLGKNNEYFVSLDNTVSEIINNYKGHNIYIHGNSEDEEEKKLYIVITSDSGLCGSYNANVLSRAVSEIEKNKENSQVMVVGEKGVSYFKRFNYKPRLKYVGVSDLPTMKEAKTIASSALELYLKNEVNEINIVYTKFISQARTEVTVKKLLPLSEEENDEYHNSEYTLLEPNIDVLVSEVIPLYFRTTILNLLINSKTSEQAVRMSAMDGATKSADELLDKLKLQYNRQRQSAITQEISEIVGGAEAQK